MTVLTQTEMRLALQPGDATMLGALMRDGGVNFALWSAHAERVELIVFIETDDPHAPVELGRADLPARDGDVWHGFAPGLERAIPGKTLSYGYRVHGPFNLHEGHRFDASKLLLDPYAKALTGKFRWCDGHFSRGHKGGALVNAGDTLRGVVPRKLDSVLPHHPPNHSWSKTLIAETHVRGFTINHPQLSPKERGTFAGLGTEVALDWLKALGVTAIELMPVHSFIHDHRLVELGLRNYWGYNTLNYFTPHQAYASGDPVGEMAEFVAAAHDRGLEVLLDVVYNHTAEGSHLGPTLSFRGIDNAGYYRLNPHDRSRYADITGCGSTLNAASSPVRRLVVDSLVHWVERYGVDGFRFDLAPQLAKDEAGHFQHNGLILADIANEPKLARSKMISESWDASGGYHLGDFPNDWSEWDGSARDGLRSFWRGDAGRAGAVAEALSGSPHLFRGRGKPRRASITYAACHDDFPLADLTRYANKHNHANGENNRDGHNEPLSANYGVEGHSEDPTIVAVREQQVRNMLTTVYLGLGTPMLLAGDEFGRTQHGNNNAYAQDNETSWHDWQVAFSPQGQARTRFVRRLAALRAELMATIGEGWAEPFDCSNPSVTWWSLWGEPMTPGDWSDPATRTLAMLTGSGDNNEGGDWLLALNASNQAVRLRMPHGSARFADTARWTGLLDTAEPTRPAGTWRVAGGDGLMLAPRSVQVLRLEQPHARMQTTRLSQETDTP
jgi:isoamylase